ncbi:MAG: hypothetical protein EOP50_20660, partial [Sphingobacteriales bacterium]
MANAYLYRMPSGIPGDVTRRSHSTIEAVMLGATPFASFGIFGKVVSGKFVPIGAGDTAADLRFASRNESRLLMLAVSPLPTRWCTRRCLRRRPVPPRAWARSASLPAATPTATARPALVPTWRRSPSTA